MALLVVLLSEKYSDDISEGQPWGGACMEARDSPVLESAGYRVARLENAL